MAAALAAGVGIAVLTPAMTPALGSVAAVGATAGHGRAVAVATASAKTGPWRTIGSTTDIQAGTPAVWTDSSHRAWTVWLRQPGTQYTYEYAAIASSGALAKAPADLFGGQRWGGLTGRPTLLGQGGKPLLVFHGADGTNGSKYNTGCVYGALGATAPWPLQSWSLSASCTNPEGIAAQSATGVLATAWPGGWQNGHGVVYHIGISPSIPATTADSHLAVAGDVSNASIANDTSGNGHFYVAYARTSSGSQDGIYASDVTAHGAVLKAPGSGTNTVVRIGQFANLALTATNTHGGVYLAYCSNSATTCTVKVWRVGANKAVTVPKSAGGYDVALSAGPSGRLWVAWYDEATNRVSVARSNRADTRFGSVARYATPCFEHGLLGLSSGQLGRVDVVLQCLDTKLRTQEYYTQSGAALDVTLAPKKIEAGEKHRIKVEVTDAGDPVAGATVRLGKHTAQTNAKGKARIKVRASSGRYRVVATKSGYAKGKAKLRVSD